MKVLSRFGCPRAAAACFRHKLARKEKKNIQPSMAHSALDTGITFASGAAYGVTTVIVGQPFDTIKTITQSSAGRQESMLTIGRHLFETSGLRGLWRGSTPLVLGGTFMRSAQFGCNDLARDTLRDSGFPHVKIFGVIDSHVVLAGMFGGVGRAIVEGPTEYFKIRQQIVSKWAPREALSGLGITTARNTGLFAVFVCWIDVTRPLGLHPFFSGALCSNLSWLMLWPMDVVKTQRQSGKFGDASALSLLSRAASTGMLYRGLVPGLIRSSVANGTSMYVYKRVHAELSRLAGREDHDNI